MSSPITCPTCGLVVGPDEVSCPRDGTQLQGAIALGPNATMLEADEAAINEPTLIRKKSDLRPRSEATVADPLVGTSLGEYRVEERIGSGGMGIVYRGLQPEIGKAVAIKVLRPEIAGDPAQVRRLLAEARAVNAIRHRGIIDIFSFGRVADGRQYFVMELLNGTALDEVLAERGQLPSSEVLGLLDEVLAALGAAHAAGVIHRDLKPSNIFLVSQPDGSRYLKLLDFGLARHSAVPGTSSPQTRNIAVGTAEYMSPEQARGRGVGPPTDLYSLGVMAFEMVTSRLPFTGASPVETMIAHQERPPERPSVHAPEVLPGLEELILRLLEKDPAQRPQTAEAVRQEVQRLARACSAPPPPRQATPRRASNPRLAAARPSRESAARRSSSGGTAKPRGRLSSGDRPKEGSAPTGRYPWPANDSAKTSPGDTAEQGPDAPGSTILEDDPVGAISRAALGPARPEASPSARSSSKWPIIVTAVAVALAVLLGLLYLKVSSRADPAGLGGARAIPVPRRP